MKFFKSLILALCCMFPIILSGCENENISSLSTPTNLNVTNGIISFSSVEDADYYSISINDKVFNVDAKYNSNVEIVDTVVHYNANKLLSFNKTYSIKVKARGNEKYDSHYTATVEYLHNIDLEMPKNVLITAKTLTWDNVNDASYYIVKVFYKTKNKTEEITCDVNYCDLSAMLQKYGTGEYQYSVKAVRAGTVPAESIFSDVVNYLHYQQLETPTIQSVYKSGNDIKMNVTIDENANKITIYCDDDYRNVMLNGTSQYVTKTATTFTINLTGIFGADQFSVLKKYVFSVQAKLETILTSYFINSELSTQKTYNKTEQLSKPTLSLTFDNSLGEYVVSWQAIENAVGYIVVVDDLIEYFVESDKANFILDESFISAKIKAIGAGNYLDSDYSNIVNK